MTEQELRERMDVGFEKAKSLVEQMTNLLMDAFEQGFETGFKLGLDIKEQSDDTNRSN